jgi:hypothetical protein
LKYPGIDGENPSLHGHFVDVKATFSATQVPEPSVVWLIAFSLRC